MIFVIQKGKSMLTNIFSIYSGCQCLHLISAVTGCKEIKQQEVLLEWHAPLRSYPRSSGQVSRSQRLSTLVSSESAVHEDYKYQTLYLVLDQGVTGKIEAYWQTQGRTGCHGNRPRDLKTVCKWSSDSGDHKKICVKQIEFLAIMWSFAKVNILYKSVY